MSVPRGSVGLSGAACLMVTGVVGVVARAAHVVDDIIEGEPDGPVSVMRRDAHVTG
jgi:hypothetical protein